MAQQTQSSAAPPSMPISKVNALLRLVTLGVRGLVVVVFARHLAPHDLGAFAIMTAGVAFALLALGADFYVYANRELPGASPDKIRSTLLNQSVVIAGCYAMVGPVAVYLACQSPELNRNLWWFIALTAFEHINQEISRVVLVLGRVTLSSVLLFVRSASWVVVLVPLFEVDPALRRLDVILCGWLIASALACSYGFYWVIRNYGRGAWGRVDAAWIARGAKVAVLYLASTLLFRGISTLDRFMIERLAGAETVARYALATTIGMVIPNVTDPAVLAYAFPQQILAFKDGDAKRFRSLAVGSARSALAVIVVLATCGIIAGAHLGKLMGNPRYDIPIQWLLSAVIAGVLFTLALLPNYVLYAARKDVAILSANVAGFLVFAIGMGAAARSSSVRAVLFSVAAAYGSLFASKTTLAVRVMRKLEGDTGGTQRPMKRALAVLYTPLHVAALVRTLPHLSEFDQIHVLHWGMGRRSPKFAHYLDVLKSMVPASGQIVVHEGWRAKLTWLGVCVCGLARWARFESLVTGNPRRTPSLLAALAARNVVLVDEGSGTTHTGGYFDASVPETSRAKMFLQRLGVVPDYVHVFRRVDRHYTVYRRSIFPRPVFIPYVSASPHPVEASESGKQVLVVSSGMRFRGIEPYIEMLRTAVERAPKGSPVLFCPHPADDPQAVAAVVRAVQGAAVLSTPLLLEEYCAKLVESGGTVTLCGDGNSTSMLLDEVMPANGRYINETGRVA